MEIVSLAFLTSLEPEQSSRSQCQELTRVSVIARNALMEQYIKLQQTVIILLCRNNDNAIASNIHPHHFELYDLSESVQKASIGALTEQYQRFTQAAPVLRTMPKLLTQHSPMVITELPHNDELYLDYHGVIVTHAVRRSIKYDNLSFRAIAFWEEFVEREILSKYSRATIVMLRPSKSALLLASHDPISLRSALPDLNNKTHVFLPVTDFKFANTIKWQYTHWSLLVISCIDGLAYHYNPLGWIHDPVSTNEHRARLMTERMQQLLGTQLRFVDMDVKKCLLDRHDGDHGVFMCSLMEYLAEQVRLSRARAQDKINLEVRGKWDAAGYKKMMLDILEAKRKETARFQEVYD